MTSDQAADRFLGERNEWAGEDSEGEIASDRSHKHQQSLWSKVFPKISKVA